MNLIDMHCDTICELLSEKTPGQDLKKNNLKVDIEKLKRGGSAAQFLPVLWQWMNFWGSPGMSRHMNMSEEWRLI